MERGIHRHNNTHRSYFFWSSIPKSRGLSRLSILTVRNLITLFGVDSHLIKLDKCLIFLNIINLSMMFNWLIKYSTFINKVIRFGYIIYYISTEVLFFKNKVFLRHHIRVDPIWCLFPLYISCLIKTRF